MFEQELQRKFQDFGELGIPEYIPREGPVHVVDRTVSTVIGARRAGKSFRVLQAADEMIKAGTIPSSAHLCVVDFDNPILSGMTAADLGLIQGKFLTINPSFGLKTPLLFILDEIHRVKGWEEYLIDLSRNPNWRVLVTGSSSKLLRDEIPTALRGKALSSTVYPLSFSEYLKFRPVSSAPGSTRGDAEIRARFDDYLKWGGYPAMPAADARARENLLREYFDTMILNDILERHGGGKPQQCVALYHYLLSLIGRPCTLASAYEFIKAGGHATSRDAVREYMSWAGDAWLLFFVPILARSQKELERNYRKVYCIDWALALRNGTVWDGSYSQALENMVFLHLTRRYPRVCYYLTRSGRQEVDFVACDERGKPTLAVQVCQDLSLPETQRREIEPMVATAKYFGTRQNHVVTLGRAQTFKEGPITIHAVPAWRWLTGDGPA